MVYAQVARPHSNVTPTIFFTNAKLVQHLIKPFFVTWPPQMMYVCAVSVQLGSSPKFIRTRSLYCRTLHTIWAPRAPLINENPAAGK